MDYLKITFFIHTRLLGNRTWMQRECLTEMLKKTPLYGLKSQFWAAWLQFIFILKLTKKYSRT